jgi:uncharacterized protein (TIGR00251 family)
MLRHIKNNHLQIRVKPGMPRTEIIGWDEGLKALKVHVHAKPEDNKANYEIIKLFRKLTKRDVEIVSGGTGRDKLLRFS